MVVFEVATPLAGPLLVASMHGAVDVARPRHLYPYALLACPPLAADGDLATALFFAASVRHFGHDLGFPCSAALHAACGLGFVVGQADAAFAAMSVYFCCVHTPLAYWSMARREEWAALAAGAALSAACVVLLHAFAPSTDYVHVTITEFMQRVVTCHVLCEESVTSRKE